MSWFEDKVKKYTGLTILGGPAVSGAVAIKEGLSELSGEEEAEEAAAAARSLAASNVRFIGLESAEMERRATEQFEADKSQIKGAMAASGIITETGTSKMFLEEMTKSFQKEMDWSKVATKSRQEIAEKGGGIAAMQIEQQQRTAKVSMGMDIAGFFL